MIAVRNKLSALGHKIIMVFLSLSVLTGCNIWEDLPECPPTTGKMWIGLTFTHHNTKDENKDYIDLFGETVRRTDLFIFNEDNLLIKKIEDVTGPFTNGYRIPIELPVGTYHAVAWNNLYSNEATTLFPVPVEGSTKKEELTVQLSELENKEITLHSLPLLYGSTEPFTVTGNEHKKAEDTVIPISLLRNTNEINITVKWIVASTGQLCHDASHVESTQISIKDNNGIYDFDNVQQALDVFTYIPSYHTNNLKVNREDGGAMLYAKSTVMRLFPDSSPQLEICNVLPDNSKEIVYTADLMADFIGKIYQTQEQIDRCPSFDIEITFKCYSWVAVDITVNGWKLEDSGDVDIE